MSLLNRATILKQMLSFRGMPAASVAAKTSIDTTKGTFSFRAMPNFGNNIAGDAVEYTGRYAPYYRGMPYNISTANEFIDATNGFSFRAYPFYYPYTTPTPPSSFNATRMFMIF